MTRPSSAPWVVVSPGFHRDGGMDKANRALAEHLLERGTTVHLVGHEIAPELVGHPGARAHVVRRPAGAFLLAERALDRRGRAVAAEVTAAHPGARVVVNGGNCGWYDVNWVHYVHHAWIPAEVDAPLPFRVNNRLMGFVARRRERVRVGGARIVLSNSEVTRRHLIEHLEMDPGRVRTVYLGSDPAWGVPGAGERAAARGWLEQPEDRPLVVFVGGLGYDERKGFDTLLEAWRRLCSHSGWDADLVVAGGGRGIRKWQAEVERLGLAGRVRLLGFTSRVPELLAAADLLVSPVRYEAYGLNVQEALCRGVPAMVSGCAGIAERYTEELRELVVPDAEDAGDIAGRLLRWRGSVEEWKGRIQPLGELLRGHTWREMAREIVAVVEAGP